MREKIVVPAGMLKAANEALRASSPSMRSLEEITLEAALRWLDEILYENNVDFHRAILEAEKKRCPGNDEYGSVIARRVDFEYGVSFARNYIRDLFLAPESEVTEQVRDLLFPYSVTEKGRTMDANERIAEAFRRGQKAKEK